MYQPRSYRLASEAAQRHFARMAKAPTNVDVGSENPGTNSDLDQGLPTRLFELTFQLFNGQVPEFHACDSAFHDLDHTMQAALAVLDLLAAIQENSSFADLQPRDWEIALAATLFHDTGYLKRIGDESGSGAKYSLTHVGRSCFVAWDVLPHVGFNPDELRQIQHAICTTSASVDMDQIGFRGPREWLIGAIVGTGDMIGQMAAEDYPERLASLYLEFREAKHFSRLRSGNLAVYRSLSDVLNGTEKFFSEYVLPLLDNEWRGLYRTLTDLKGQNHYMDRIRHNVRRASGIAKLLCTA
jgi:hypothetical protein